MTGYNTNVLPTYLKLSDNLCARKVEKFEGPCVKDRVRNTADAILMQNGVVYAISNIGSLSTTDILANIGVTYRNGEFILSNLFIDSKISCTEVITFLFAMLHTALDTWRFENGVQYG